MTVRSVREWSVPVSDQETVALTIYELRDEQPQVTVQAAMELVLESKRTEDFVKRYRQTFASAVRAAHELIWRGMPVPKGYASYRDGVSVDAKLANKTLLPLSCLFALLAVAVGRNRADVQRRAAWAWIGIVRQLCQEGPAVQMEWRRFGDNQNTAFALTSEHVNPSHLWTQPALVRWLLPGTQAALDHRDKDWFDGFTFAEPCLARVILMCLGPQVLKKQALLKFYGLSAVGFLAAHFAQHVEHYTTLLELGKQNALKRTSLEESLQSHFRLQEKVRKQKAIARPPRSHLNDP